MLLHRLGTATHPVWDGAGAALAGGRWNSVGIPVIYAASNLSLAMLERLVQRRSLGETRHVVTEVPADLPFDDLLANPPTGWQAIGSPEAVAAGRRWLAAGATPLLRVPSALVPSEANWVVNPAHPAAARLRPGAEQALRWDPRLFGIPPP